jgi:hypothetical protein
VVQGRGFLEEFCFFFFDVDREGDADEGGDRFAGHTRCKLEIGG